MATTGMICLIFEIELYLFPYAFPVFANGQSSCCYSHFFLFEPLELENECWNE